MAKSKSGGSEVASLVMMAGVFGMLGAAAVLAHQAYSYLRHGGWISLSALDGLKIVHIPWASQPTDWIGLHQTFDWLPLSGTLFVLGLITTLAGMAMMD